VQISTYLTGRRKRHVQYRALHNCLKSRLQSCTDKCTGTLPPTHCPQVQPRDQTMASQSNIYSLFWIWKITISDIQNKCLFWISEIIISYIGNTFFGDQKSFWDIQDNYFGYPEKWINVTLACHTKVQLPGWRRTSTLWRSLTVFSSTASVNNAAIQW